MKSLLTPFRVVLLRHSILLFCLVPGLVACCCAIPRRAPTPTSSVPISDAATPTSTAVAPGPSPTGGVATLTSTAVVPGPSPTSSAATPMPTEVALPVISDAKALAETVYQATDPEARYQALLLVMRALNVGVYEPQTGRAILRGAERGPQDFYLYDFELRALASGLEREQVRDMAYLSDLFTRSGILSADSKPFDAEALQQMLLEAARTAADDDDPPALIYRLVRELGLLHAAPYDLLQDVPLEELQLDALQAFLIEADVLVPMAQEQLSLEGDPGIKLAMDVSGGQLDAHPGLQGPCDGIGGLGSVSLWAKYLLGIIPVAKVVVLTIDMIHGEVLAYSVQVKALNKEQFTHYGHESPGTEMRFEVKVEMLDDYGDFLVNCGSLAGYQVPAQGGIPGVSIIWDKGGLDKHGTVSYDPPDRKTNQGGVAALILKPKNESRPGQGIEKQEKGTVMALAEYQSAFGNLPGSIAQYLTPKTDFIAWTVERHVNLTLDIELFGDIVWEGGKWNLDGNKVSIPLTKGSDGLEGSAPATFTFKLSGECTGTSTWSTDFTVKTTANDPINISVSTPFVPVFSITCDDETNNVQLPQVPAGKGPTFDLPVEDGASTTLGNMWRFTLREQ